MGQTESKTDSFRAAKQREIDALYAKYVRELPSKINDIPYREGTCGWSIFSVHTFHENNFNKCEALKNVEKAFSEGKIYADGFTIKYQDHRDPGSGSLWAYL